MDTIKLPEPAIVEPVPERPAKLTPDAKNVVPQTTAEDDLRTSSQRRVNLIWEFTQATIAILITVAVIVSVFYGLSSELLASAFGMVIGMYLQRTNHTKVGGIGGTDTR